MSLLIVGSIALDSIETPFGSRERAVGGSAIYAGIAASYFTDVKLVGVIGSDFPGSMIKTLESRGIDLAGVQRKTGKTFYWKGKYHTDMNVRDTLDTQLNVFEQFNPSLPESYRSTPYIFLGNIQPSLQLNVLDQVRSPVAIACDTMNLWINTTPDQLREVLSRIKILLINDSEARMIAKEGNVFKAIPVIRNMGPEILIIKKGEHGVILNMSDSLFFLPAFPLLAFKDPTGAGDTFAGGFMGYLAQNDDLSEKTIRRAIVYGSVLASYCVEEFSVENLTGLTEQKIDERYEMFARMVRFE